MDAAALLDAQLAAGVLLTLGLMVAVGGRIGDVWQRTIGGFIAVNALTLAVTAAGNWHGTPAGHAVGITLLVLSGVRLLTIPRCVTGTNSSSLAQQAAHNDDEVCS